MKKEVVVAILIGLSFGLIITYGLFRVHKAVTAPTTNSTITFPTNATATPTPAGAMLTILSPEDGHVQEESEVTVTGTATPDSIVVLFVNGEEFISSADASGSFSFTVALEEGSTILSVHAIDENGVGAAEERVVVVSKLLSEQPDTRADTEASSAAKAK
ncbi:MAG: hypothetical protein COY80_04075 [Candidatus Pacebacteria bacterium CG_4_10_14_0_8_um_filter_42_14]|nr:MAG: hypothetical protein COY80_04075 [Candidatus Pacebacteria bacterium CG_4_10_14_0_8_um_filter_42_14]